jgi:two-component system, OmpR family, response regulator
MKVLIVEDDLSVAESLAEALTELNHVVDVARDGQSGLDYVDSRNFDLILLDVGLPKLNGIDLCQRIRRDGKHIPVLMITARDSLDDKIKGLDAGADDYMIKPFELPELEARMRALLRRGNFMLPPILEWGLLQLNPNTCEVKYDQKALHLTPKEYGLLEIFLRNSHRIFSRDKLIESLWTFNEPPGEETVKMHIKSLRHKLKSSGAPEDLIETVYGLGYRLNQKVAT